MTDLTSTLLVHHRDYEVEEWSKSGEALRFDSGKEQRVVTTSIPAITLTIDYKPLTYTQYNTLREAYENNHASAFLCDLDSFIDKRPTFMTLNAATWTFSGFTFSIDAKTSLYKGKITLITSVFFNFSAYQDLFTQSSNYTRSTSTDDSFQLILDDAPAYQTLLSYASNNILSSIGNSVRHSKDKGGLLRTWSMSWLLNESQVLKLITFYRKNGGVMGEFGMPESWSSSGQITNARFVQDSIQYNKRVDGLYACRADFIEVK